MEAQDIQKQVEERLKAQQEGKEFKDIGKVAYTKKEMAAYRLISSKMLVDLEVDPTIAFNMVKKENVWPAYNVQELKEKGVSSGAAFMMVKLRTSVPNKPENSPNKRSSYVHFLELLQSDLQKCMTYSDVYNLAQEYQKMPLDKLIEYFIDPSIFQMDEENRILVLEKAKNNPSIQKFTSRGSIYNLFKEVFATTFANLIFNKTDATNAVWYQAREFAALSEEDSKTLIDKQIESTKKQVEENNAEIEKIKSASFSELKKIAEKYYRLSSAAKKIYYSDQPKLMEFLLETFQRKNQRRELELAAYKQKYSPRLEDWSWFEKPKTESDTPTKKREKSINTKEPLSYIKRIGGYKINTVKAQEIIDLFGFSAVNYGKYVDDAWSKQHTKHFLGAISDLGDVLNIDIKKVNEIGGLSIAFGAKGIAGHMATYFSQSHDINLTRGNGDGSVAHEWGHYFDNILCDLSEKKAEPKFASASKADNASISDIVSKIMNFIYKGDPEYTPRIPMTFYAKKSSSVPSYYSYKYGNQSIKILDTIEETLDQYLDLAEVNRDRYNTQLRVFGYIIDAFGLDKYLIPMKLTTSYHFHKSAYFSFVYSGTKENGQPAIITGTRSAYWTKNVELFARAWETVILKKLLDKNRVSNYLVADINMQDVIDENWFQPYPQGKELEYLETLIDELIDAFKLVYSVGDFNPPSSIREDEYLDLSPNTDEGKTESGMVIDKSTETKTTTFIENDKVVEQIKKPRKPRTKKTEAVSPEPSVAAIEENSLELQEDEEPKVEEMQEQVKNESIDDSQINVSLYANNWNQVPIRWKNVKGIRPIVVSLNPFDKNLLSLAKIIVNTNINFTPKPIFSAMSFDSSGVTFTDAKKLVHIAGENIDYTGNYPTSETSKFFPGSIEKQTKELNAIQYPNWRSIVPKESKVEKIEIDKLYQYVVVALNYANKINHTIGFKFSNSDFIGFDGEFLKDILEVLMKLQHTKDIYVHWASSSRAVLFSYEKSIDIEKSTYALLMPMMLHDGINQLGASDIDYKKDLNCYFDFSDNQIYNADGSVADYKENYGDAPGMSLNLISMFASFLKSSKSKKDAYFYSYIRVDNDSILVSDKNTRLEIPNDYDLITGLYTIENNVLIRDISADIDNYSLEKRIATKDPIFVANTEQLLFYMNKMSNHLSDDDDFRPKLSGYIFEKKDNQVNAVSTDAHTLIKLDITNAIESSIDEFNVILGNATTLMNVSKSWDSKKVAVYIDSKEEKYRIVSDRIHFEGKLYDKGVTNWRAVTPNIVNNQLKFNVKDLFSCLTNPELKKYADKFGSKVKDLALYNNFNEVYAIYDAKNNNESIKVCDLKLNHTEINELFNINESYVLIMPVVFTNGNYFNLGIGKLEDVMNSIGKEECTVVYKELNSGYVFTSENLYYKNSDVYKPEKPKKVQKPVVKPSEPTNQKQEILDALTGAKTLLKYVSGEDKSNLSAYIRGLEILMK